MHERLLAIGFLDYSFKTMLRQLIFPYCIYIVYPRFCFLVAIQPRLAAKRDKRWVRAKRDKHWVCIPPFRPSATFPRKRGEGFIRAMFGLGRAPSGVNTGLVAKPPSGINAGLAPSGVITGPVKRRNYWARKRRHYWAHAKRGKHWARGQLSSGINAGFVFPLPACGHLPPLRTLLSGKNDS